MLAAACGRAPKVGEPPQETLPASAQPAIAIESAEAASGLVVVTYRLTDRGTPIVGAAAAALKPTFTLAWLGVDPATASLPRPLRAWRSLLFTGGATNPSLPPGGPGTAALRLSQRQPGSESSVVGGAFVRTVELGDGRFRYTFLSGLPTAHHCAIRSGWAWCCTGSPSAPPHLGRRTEQLQSLHADAGHQNCNACHGLFKFQRRLATPG